MPCQFTPAVHRSQKTNLLFLGIAGLVLAFAMLGMQGCGSQQADNVTLWEMDKNCDLHTQACTANHNGASATLKVSPHPIPIARPLGIEVDLKGLNPSQVQLDISGINMYMGYNRVPLKSAKPNRWVGTSMLAFCTAETMQWQITLMLTMPDGSEVQIPYYLETSNR